jgi:hypothetical protein
VTTTTIYGEVLQRLSAVRKTEHFSRMRGGALIVLGTALCTVIVAATIEAIAYLPPSVRTPLVWLSIGIVIAALGWFILRPLLRVLGIVRDEQDHDTARRVGRRFPHINDHLENILQLFGARETTLYSHELIDASFEDVRKEIEPVDFTEVADRPDSPRLWKFVGIAAGVALLLVVLFPSAYRGAANRLMQYDRAFAAPVSFTLVVEPGNREVIRGESVPITVRVEGQPLSSLTLSSRPEGQIAFDEARLRASSSGVFSYEFTSLKSTTSYRISAGDVQSDQYTLTVVDRPFIKILRLHLEYPSYTRLAAADLGDNIGDASALKGTRITFSLETNKDLSGATVMFADSSRLQLAADGSRASGSMVLMHDRSYHIVVKDPDGRENAEPIQYTLKVIADEYPTAVIRVPGQNLDITESEILNMLFSITDDYGFSRLRIAHRLVQSRYERPQEDFRFTDIPLPSRREVELTIPYVWSLAPLNLVPEDVVSYYIEVFDNDVLSGPKSTRSETFTLRLPSLDEVFADADRGHEVSLDAMKETLEQAREAKKQLDELQQDMLKNQEKMDWQEQKKAEELLKKYQELQKNLDQVNKNVDAMVREMEKNNVLSRETMEKYQELQQLMQEMSTPEFAEAMKKMQEAMMQLSPEAMKQALQQFSFSEENFRKSIERTMNLLKRLQIEQRVDETLKRTEELMKRQEELQQQTERTNPEDRNALQDLAKQQQDLKEQLDQLQQELAELQKKMEEFPAEMPLSEMDQARQQLEESRLQEQMESIAQQMQQQQMSQAMEGQKSAMQKMGKFMQQLQQMQQAMRDNQQRQIVNEMRKSLQDLLELSKRQEALKDELKDLEQNSRRFRENAQEQMDVMRDLGNVTERMAKLSQKSFGITPEMGKSIGDAMRQMGEAMQSLEQRNGGRAGQQQEGAMGSLNEAAQQVQSAMNAMMQGGGQGMGMAGFMQRLRQMTAQQQGINDATREGGLTPQQAAELGRLAGEQGMVRKSLEQLAREAANAGQLSKMLGDLNKIAQDMREVQTDLAQGNVNPETLKKQDRILSRLLDSQRSARERDFENRRRAESGKNSQRAGPGQIDLTTQEGRNRLRQDLLKAVEEGYAKDYEVLIRKYFEALEQSGQ